MWSMTACDPPQLHKPCAVSMEKFHLKVTKALGDIFFSFLFSGAHNQKQGNESCKVASLLVGWWRLSGLEFGLRCNPILTRIFTFNFSAAVQPKPAEIKKKRGLHKSALYTINKTSTYDPEKQCLHIIITLLCLDDGKLDLLICKTKRTALKKLIL